jgi:glycosyltransferase involved in cell wall biosynthesis
LTHHIILGPIINLHAGYHAALATLPPKGFRYDRRHARHTFLFPPDSSARDRSPFRNVHWGELVDFGRGSDLVHAARWPVLNRPAWIVDTDELGYPLVAGRRAWDPAFRREVRSPWTPPFHEHLSRRVYAMLRAYAHPSCRAILFRTRAGVRNAARMLAGFGVDRTLSRSVLRKCQVAYPPVAAPPYPELRRKWKADAPLRVVFCGRDYVRKKGEFTVRLFSRLSQEFPHVHFTYVGDVPVRMREGMMSRRGHLCQLSDLPRPRLLSLLARSHILFHPSLCENGGMILYEAAAAGMAIVTARGRETAGVTEILDDEGALFVDRDGIPASREEQVFEERLRYLIETPDRILALGRSNHEMMTRGRFSPVRLRHELAAIYERALEDPSREPLAMGDLRPAAESAVPVTCRSTRLARDYRLFLEQVRPDPAAFSF